MPSDLETHNMVTDLRGVGQLSIEAVNGITNLVEALHQTIASSAGILDSADRGPTKGITGLVYRNVRAITGLVGGGLDTLLAPLGSLLGDMDSPPAREAVLAALNGLAGDHLAATNNPLAIPMRLRRGGNPVDMAALSETMQQSGRHLLIMVNGAMLNDLQWQRKGHDHGAALARDLGFIPLYLHYNTGLHVSQNGRKLAHLLENITTQLPQPLSLTIFGYSMGGLVTRSACYYGKRAGYNWYHALENLLFLGTPHHGAPYERGGNWINTLLDISPYSAPFARLGKIRSSGLTDLRHGHVLDEDWLGRDRFDAGGDQRHPVPLPDGVNCYAIAASTSKNGSQIGDNLLGDGLVPLDSALGRHANPQMDLHIPESRQWIGRPMNHLDLLNETAVYETIKNWLSV